MERKIICSISALFVSLAMLLIGGMPAQADVVHVNVFPIQKGGTVNCKAGDTCVEKIGDTAQVSWTVQTTPLALSSDESQISGGTLIAVPKVVENVTFETVALPDPNAVNSHNNGDASNKPQAHKVNKISYPVRLLPAKLENMDASEGSVENNYCDGAVESSPSLSNSPTRWCAKWYTPKLEKTTDSAANEAAFKKAVEAGLAPKINYAENVELYNFIELPLSANPGVSTFKLSGTVKVESENTYLPVRIYNHLWHCLLEYCDSLSEMYPEIDTGAFPEYSLTDEQVNERIAALQHESGRLGSKQCSPTSEVAGALDTLGTDTAQPITPEDRIGDWYVKTFNLHLNPAVSYLVSGYEQDEDGCDQADMHITICAPQQPQTPPAPDTPEPAQPQPDNGDEQQVPPAPEAPENPEGEPQQPENPGTPPAPQQPQTPPAPDTPEPAQPQPDPEVPGKQPTPPNKEQVPPAPILQLARTGAPTLGLSILASICFATAGYALIRRRNH